MPISRSSCFAAGLAAARYNAAKRMPLTRILALAAAALVAQAATTGPEVGQAIPAFSMPDQAGTVQTLKSVMGPKGALLVFYRSADW
jgi:hypothetical protein